MLAAAALWSTIGVASSYGQDVPTMAVVRATLAALIALAVNRSFSKGSIIAGALLGALFSLYPLAAIVAGVGAAAFLLYTAPLWTALASSVYERPTIGAVFASLLVLISVSLLGVESAKGGISAAGLLLGLLSGASYGLYIAVARYYSRKGLSREVSLGAFPFAALATAPLLLFARPSAEAIGAGAYLAVFATLLPYWLFTMGVQRISAVSASVIATLEPVLAALWGSLLFGENVNLLKGVAYGLILLAVFLASYPRRGGERG